MNRRSSLFAAAIALACSAASPAFAQGEGRLMFINPSTGAWASGGVDQLGAYHLNSAGWSAAYIGRTDLFATNAAFMTTTYWNYTGVSLNLDNFGKPAPGGSSFTAHMPIEQRASLGGFAFFYGANGSAEIYRTSVDGAATRTFATTSFSPWTNIVATDNYLLFYNYNNDVIATGVITNAGGFQQTFAGSVKNAYSSVASLGDNVLFYNPFTRQGEAGQIMYAGANQTNPYVKRQDVVFDDVFSDFVKSKNYLLLYSSSTGNAETGHFTTGGYFVVDQRFHVGRGQFNAGAGYSTVIPCGPFLLFYDLSSGLAQVGEIRNDGSYAPTQYLTAGKGWALVAASHN
jgi:hypothetical protein